LFCTRNCIGLSNKKWFEINFKVRSAKCILIKK
jgi:hypothetical protein